MKVLLCFILLFGCYVHSDSDLNSNDAVDPEYEETTTVSVKELTTNSTSNSTRTEESAVPEWQKVLDDIGEDSDDDDEEEENSNETLDYVNENENPSSLNDDNKILSETSDGLNAEGKEPMPDNKSGENVSKLKNDDVIMADDLQDKDLASGTKVPEQKNEEISEQSNGKLKDALTNNADKSEADAQSPNEDKVAFELDLTHQLLPEDQSILRDEEDEMNKPRNFLIDSENRNGYEQPKDFDVIDYLISSSSVELIDEGEDMEEKRLVQREKLVDQGAGGQMVVILAVFCVVSLVIVFITIITVRKLKARMYADRKMLVDEDEMYYFSI